MEFNITKVKNLRHAITSTLDQIRGKTNRVCILVPDKLTVTIEKTLFEYLNIESSFNIEVTTLTRFSQKILTELDISYKSISKIGSIVLIKKILNESADKLKLFNSATYSYNYGDILFRTLTQFKSSKITIDDIIVDDKKPEQIKNKIYDIKLLMQEYENQKAEYVDESDRLNLFTMNIHKSSTIKSTEFYFLGYDDFTSQGYSVIEHLIKNAKSVNIALYSNSAQNKSIYPTEVFDKLTQLAYIQGLPLNFNSSNYNDDDNHLFLADNLLSRNNQTFDIDNEILLFNCSNIEQEIERVARDIRRQIIQGQHYYNFGVACYEMEKYKDIFSNIFDKYEINYYIDSATSLSNSIVYKFFLNFLNLFNNHFQTNDLLDFINSPFINLSNQQKLSLNQIIIETNFSGNLEYLPVPEDLQESKDYLISILNTFQISQSFTISELIEKLGIFSKYLDLETQIFDLANSSSTLYNKKIMEQSQKSLNDLLHNIEQFYSEIRLSDFIDILESASKDQKIMPIPQSLDCVQIIDAQEIFTNFDNLYILNSKASTSPAFIQDVGIILDNDIENMGFKKKLSPTIAHLNELARFKAFNSYQMFNNVLQISMSIYNDSEISPLVKDLQKHLTCKKEKLNIEYYNTKAKHYEPLSKYDMIEFLTQNHSKFHSYILEMYDFIPYIKQDYLNQESKEFINFNEISCSALETYFKCPMQFFLTHILKLKSEREQGIAKVDIGNMLHLLAQEYYKFKISPNKIIKFVESRLFKYMQSDKKLAQYINTPIHLNLIKEANRFLTHLSYLDENSQFSPTHFEYKFDISSDNNFPIADDVYLRGKIDRIDFYDNFVRIIDYKTGNVDASLKDLYYGKKLQLFMYGKIAQKLFNKNLAGTFYMPVKNSIAENSNIVQYKLNGFYLNDNSLSEAFDKRIKSNLKSDLMNLSLNKDGEIKVDSRTTKILSPATFNRLLDYSLDLSKLAIEEIKSGYIQPSPIKFSEYDSSCSFCKFLPICRKNSLNIPSRQSLDINLDSFGGNYE